VNGAEALVQRYGDFFDRARAVVVARAPGRLDVMGGIADYSGSLVLELPLANATVVAVQSSDDAQLVVRSQAEFHGADLSEVTIPLEALAPDGRALPYDAARDLFRGLPGARWPAYVLGAYVVLAHERELAVRGARLFIDSNVPMGKGVASSAAIEVASMRAICAAANLDIDGRELGILAQKVENLVVGAPCGVMDQMTSACGEANGLLALLCQPAQIVGQVELPAHLEVWGIDSGIRHDVTGADYGAVRVGTFMGYRILADVAGFEVSARRDGIVEIVDPKWHGYLANVSVDDWSTSYRHRLPESIGGAEFLERYGGTTDSVTTVDPARTYPVRQCAEHAVMESQRVQEFRRLLESGARTDDAIVGLGSLMYASHASYGACGLGSSGTDRLVELVRSAGPDLAGAKITGGGSGGTVAVLARAGSRALIDDIVTRYKGETGNESTVLGGSSDGAMRSGIIRLKLP
jgi:L-arabinokinase